jgi:AI-2 transport protein TqsA
MIQRLITVAAIVVVVGGMRFAAPIIVPFLVAIFLAIILDPVLHALKQKGVPLALGIGLVIFSIGAAGAVLLGVVSSSIGSFSHKVGGYELRLNGMIDDGEEWLEEHGIDVLKNAGDEIVPARQILSLIAGSLTGLQDALKNAFLILMTLMFLMTETATFAQKMKAIEGKDGSLSGRVDAIIANVRRYISIKTSVSLATGVLIGVSLWLLGLDFPVLWGLIAFLLNYVPNIGSLIAAIPAVLLALIQFGIPTAIGVGSIFLVVNQVLGTLIEPRLQGRGLGLSPLVVFVSLVFWGWVFGPVGMFLSAPLTMIVKIAIESDPDTEWVAVMLGPGVPDERPT